MAVRSPEAIERGESPPRMTEEERRRTAAAVDVGGGESGFGDRLEEVER